MIKIESKAKGRYITSCDDVINEVYKNNYAYNDANMTIFKPMILK